LKEDCAHMEYPVKKAVMIFDVKEGTIEMQNLDNEVPESDT
jgi:hypothetical protein